MKNNNKKGFTLVELVIVVAVMAILVAVAVPTIGSISQSAKNAVYNSNCRTIESVIKLAEAEAAKNGDGKATLTGAQIQTAINDAKLGIQAATGTESTFSYNPTTGVVAKDGGTYEISFDGTGVASVTPQT